MKLYKLKIAFRNARKNGVLTFAKLFGLSISFAVILFAAGYVVYETGFDKSIPGHDKIYRCLMQGKLNNQEADFAVTSPAMAGVITAEIPEITEATRILPQGEASVKYNNLDFNGGHLVYADPNFFSFFSISVETKTQNPLGANNNMIMAKSLAKKQFGSEENALGKVVEVRGEDCIITGVFEDLPRNFHLRAKLFQSLEKSNPDKVGWGSQSYYTYFKTNGANISPDELNFKISKTVYTHYVDDIDGASAKTLEDFKVSPEMYILYTAEKLTDIHFSNHKFDPAVTSNKTYVYGAIILALLILLISSINFINLNIANLSTRLKEIGIQKTTGANSHNIFSQFLYETIIFWLIGFVLAFAIYMLAENTLDQFLGFDISLSGSEMIKIVGGVFIALLVFNLVANFLPISFISNKKILSLIKEERPSKRGFSVNSSFVFFQFVLSGLIILASVIVQKQINYMVHKDRGYDTENVMMLSMWSMNQQTRKSFIDDLKTYSAVKSVSTSDNYFGDDPGMNDAYFETMDKTNYFHTSVMPVSADFINTFNLKIKEGRFFNQEFQSDFKGVVLNEAALKKYTGEGSILGKKVIVDGDYKVIGVVKDFNFRSLHHQIQPLAMVLVKDKGNVFVKVQNSQIAEVTGILQNLWKKYNIDFPFEYKFHDEVLAQHYLNDQQAKKLLLVLSIISIAIACVGLYAISFFTIIRKTKEIGIRKVNGARVSEVMSMLNIRFIKWVGLAFTLAIPIAHYAMHKWLESFAYKTSLSWWIFALSGFLALGIALLTVSWQSWRAATKNPVEALRYE
ncbi:FtsX-like permease family protein [Maribellus comscasis]|uniref:FtsX-like permease family protein n=1 Tax=Maribellus comscasis TaxID=2681766 RepID=A0A6I6JP04_9BACT|nr:ABC transporter permease [Maribellus comscasis]QGY44675.1 FtsX-like permease family protein [Maribellus comscasis]